MYEFPFRVGRESRLSLGYLRHKGPDRRERKVLPDNDLYLVTRGRPTRHVSREHFEILRREDGEFELIDRDSTLGTTVGQAHIGGGQSGGRIPLHDGDRIALGLPDSPYVYAFEREAPPIRRPSRRRRAVHRCIRIFLFVVAPVLTSVFAIISVVK
jgi:hypothetical protein